MDQIAVQTAPIDQVALQQWLQADVTAGAVVCFTGLVRNHNDGSSVTTLTLEHYPGMTEQALAAIVADARQRWPLARVALVHRVGPMVPGEVIVMVGVASSHRGAAFEAASCIMDRLKTEAPLWKKETDGTDSRWVDARASDQEAVKRWHG